MPDLLLELLSEEIPARMQPRGRADLKRLVTDGLVEAGLHYRGAVAHSTPRRLVLAIEGLSAASPDLVEERRGPRVDAPEKAIEGFLRSTGLPREALQVRAEKKGEVFVALIERPGRPAAEIVAEVVAHTIRTFPWPRSMRWGMGALRWVRPLQSILCLLTSEAGAEVVPLEVDGIVAGAVTRGHRFLAPDAFSVTSFEDYAAKLRRAHVLIDADERAEVIRQGAANLAFAQGCEVVEDAGLLDEVAGLVEWPVPLMGEIGADFRDLPAEVLQTSMKEHQKFFSVREGGTGRIVRFVTVANIETADHGATILAGNGRVLAARLSDAKFFWENDLRVVSQVGLQGMGAGLSEVTFHAKLGSQADRVARIAALARGIAPSVGADPDEAELAATVAKADLRSAMVGEFPELQGVMGRYYAHAAGLSDAVAAACEEHYRPLGPSDSVPSAPVSVAVALADKIDTLCGFWAIEEKPTGSKDPYALRRAALGVIRLVVENEVGILLATILENHLLRPHHAETGVTDARGTRYKTKYLLEYFVLLTGVEVGGQNMEEFWENEARRLGADLLSFLHDRLKVHLRDEGIRHDVIDACLSLNSGAPSGATPNNDDLTLLVKRARALAAFLKTDDGENLVLGFRRANNILTQAEEQDGVEYSFGPDPKLAEGPEEAALFAALDAAEAAIAPAMQAEDFAAAMAAMAALRAPIDAFFEAVQVNADNAVVRRNRLNLLHRIRAVCSGVADLTRLEG